MPLTRPRRGPLPSPHLRGEGQGEGLDVIAVNNFGYAWDFSFLWAYRGLILTGLGVTIAYTIGTILLGLIVGLITGLLRLSRNPLLTAPLVAYVEIFRCTPLLVQIVWFYYALPVVLGIDIPAHVAATLVLSLYTGAFYAEIIRGGVNSIERGQWDAARAIGMRRGQVMRHVILPQAVKRMIPPFMNQSIIQLKNTSLVSTIAVADLLYEGTIITAATYRPLEVYTMVAVIYFLVLFPLTLAAQQVERRLARAD
jgi:polar amino acid transport system permease protein